MRGSAGCGGSGVGIGGERVGIKEPTERRQGMESMMPDELEGSVSLWLAGVKQGDPAAVEPLWARYFEPLVRLARARLRERRRHSAEADEEDAALSAFESFCAGAAAGRFPRLEDRDDLWRLLVVITSRKVAAMKRRGATQKRGAGRVLREADLAVDGDHRERAALLAEVIGDEPTPEFAAEVAEEYERLLELLGNATLRRVAVLRMEGYTRDEIAERMGCARRTVARQLALIRGVWGAEEGGASD